MRTPAKISTQSPKPKLSQSQAQQVTTDPLDVPHRTREENEKFLNVFLDLLLKGASGKGKPH